MILSKKGLRLCCITEWNKLLQQVRKLSLASQNLTISSFFCTNNFIHKFLPLNLTSVGPCIVIYFYSKTNQMHNISNLFYFGTTLYILRTVFPSIIRSLRLYIQHQVYVIQVRWLLASKQPQNIYDMYLMLYV